MNPRTGKTLSSVALSDVSKAVRLPDWPYTEPLALPTVIRTVNIVLHEGATLMRESGPARIALSLGTGYRNLTLNRDRGADRLSVRYGDPQPRDREVTSRCAVTETRS